jgi:hypothetical protein
MTITDWSAGEMGDSRPDGYISGVILLKITLMNY